MITIEYHSKMLRADLNVLDLRLAKMQSRLPGLKKLHNMSRGRLAEELLQAAAQLTDMDLERQLSGILPPEELAGLAIRIRVSVERIISFLVGNQDR